VLACTLRPQKRAAGTLLALAAQAQVDC